MSAPFEPLSYEEEHRFHMWRLGVNDYVDFVRIWRELYPPTPRPADTWMPLQLREAVASLPEEQRNVVAHWYWRGVDFAEMRQHRIADMETALEVALCLPHAINGREGRSTPWAEACPAARGAEEVKCRYARAALLDVPLDTLERAGMRA